MLPDFPVQKAKLMETISSYFQQKYDEYLGFFSTIPSYRNHEGDLWNMGSSDETVNETGYQDIKSGLSIHYDEVPTLTIEKIMDKIDVMAEDMAKQTSQGIIADINQAIEEGGTTINAEGEPFSKEMFLEMLDSIELYFDKTGELDPPAILMHPKMWDKIKDDVASWEQDPALDARHNEIIARKKEAWRDRESRRKLVD